MILNAATACLLFFERTSGGLSLNWNGDKFVQFSC